MASDNEVLYVVEKLTIFDHPMKRWVFRTREAARTFAKTQTAKSFNHEYKVSKAAWGPEQ